MNAHTISVERPEGKSTFWSPRCNWEGNIKSLLTKEWVGMSFGFIWLRKASYTRLSLKPPDITKDEVLLNQLNDC